MGLSQVNKEKMVRVLPVNLPGDVIDSWVWGN